MTDVEKALRGDHKAAKRVTEARVLLPCPSCRGDEIMISRGSLLSLRTIGSYWISCMDYGMQTEIKATEFEARLAWNTRATVRENGR